MRNGLHILNAKTQSGENSSHQWTLSCLTLKLHQHNSIIKVFLGSPSSWASHCSGRLNQSLLMHNPWVFIFPPKWVLPLWSSLWYYYTVVRRVIMLMFHISCNYWIWRYDGNSRKGLKFLWDSCFDVLRVMMLDEGVFVKLAASCSALSGRTRTRSGDSSLNNKLNPFEVI